MALVPMRELLETALKNSYAVGYFEAWDQYSMEAVIEATEESRSPVIIGFGGVMMNQDWFGNGGLKRLAAMGKVTAEDAKVPVSYLLNEVESFDHIRQGLSAGFNVVMLDTSNLPLEENIVETKKVVDAANPLGIGVEGECDPLPDASGTMGTHSGAKKTDPEEAARYVSETGIDALSIAIGNEHIRAEGKSSVDFELLARIRDAVPVPLVIHGGTGYPDDTIARSIELGVAKFNVGSVMKKIFIEKIRESVSGLTDKPDFQELIGSRKTGDVLQSAKQAVKAEVMRRMAVYGSNGKA